MISIRKPNCGDTRIGKINSGKHIQRGCMISGNAFAIEQAPPDAGWWDEVSADNSDVFYTRRIQSVGYPHYPLDVFTSKNMVKLIFRLSGRYI
jgi:hypothetical protein